MLEFQEGFFEQEVRDGFYIDMTMKTVWAAELEVLQKVAEICDRHGLVWYAAYGTLLGAIRHEGFVPWDDDMDIWVKRADYNKLLKILPEELPEGYFVRSPLTKEGYDQYHMLVNSGNRVSIDPKWLEQYHGCPFSVGLDIFPLDYLARDEEERIMQENLVRIACRGAQVACTLFREGCEDAENPEKARRELTEEIEDAIHYLEEHCGIEIDHKLLEEEKWYALSSEFGKWANYFAMMYGEEESDYLVNFIDYIRQPWKKFQKEWFAEVYSATFENFMVPVPCGYSQVLSRTYGDYKVVAKKKGMHDYPYYARQLEDLKEKMRDRIKQAQAIGAASLEDMDLLESDLSLPAGWEARIQRADGKRKGIILFANDARTFLMNGKKALDKLEEVLKTFEAVQEEITLWWRPQRTMADKLETVSCKLARRYREILENYRTAGWGICDETDNTERAVELCNAYYGGMNAILQPFQNAGRSIMLAVTGEENKGVSSTDVIKDSRAFFSFSDYVEDNGKVYASNNNFNAMMIIDKDTWTLEKQVIFEDESVIAMNMHLRSVKSGHKICFLPAGVQCVHTYDMEKGTQSRHSFSCEHESEEPQEWSHFVFGEGIYLLPCYGKQGLWKWNTHTDAMGQETWWELPCADDILQHGSMDEKRFYTLEVLHNQLFVTDMESQVVESFSLPDEQVYRMVYDGQNFWYTVSGSMDIVCWNRDEGVIFRYERTDCDRYEQEILIYQEMFYTAGKIFLYEQSSHAIYALDTEKGNLEKLHSIKCERGIFWALEEKPSFQCVDGKLVCLLRNAGEAVLIDLETLEARQYNVTFHMDKQAQEYMYEIAFERDALLFEEAGAADIKMLLRHYKNSYR